VAKRKATSSQNGKGSIPAILHQRAYMAKESSLALRVEVGRSAVTSASVGAAVSFDARTCKPTLDTESRGRQPRAFVGARRGLPTELCQRGIGGRAGLTVDACR
jgi:hypothetical protein